MVQDRFFSGPKDVTDEYRRRTKSSPRLFSILLAFWTLFMLFTIVKGPAWQLISALALVAIMAGFYPVLFEKRRYYVKALGKGPIEQVSSFIDDRIEQVVRSRAEPNLIIERKTLDLSTLFEVRLVGGSVWVSVLNEGNITQVIFDEVDFQSPFTRREFVDLLINRVNVLPSDNDDYEDGSCNPLIPKH